MLVQLVIQDFALIENVELMFGHGLNVLTGETGAGKSIIVDAMNLLVGGRASSNLVRTGTEKALVQGYFDCSSCGQVADKMAELGLPLGEDNTLLLGREVSSKGRSVCRVNGRVVPLAMYRSLGELLVDIHGQHEHQSLLRVSQHRDLLDRFCGQVVLEQRSLVSKTYHEMVQLQDECKQKQLSESEAYRRLDYLQYVVAEIDDLQPVPGEEEELQKKRDRLRHGEKLTTLAQEAVVELKDNDGRMIPAYDLLSRAAEKLDDMAELDSETEEMAQSLKDILFRLDDVIEKLRFYQEQLDFDPEHAREVEERFIALSDLMRKYGSSLAEVCAYGSEAAAEMEALKGAAQHREELEAEYQKAVAKYDVEAKKLSALRREGSVSFCNAVAAEFHGLGLEKASLEIGWAESANPTAAGYDMPEFLFSANPGEPLKPLAKIASGGEMSRVMLALKVVLAKNDQIPTLIFDEIDAGIGGLTLQAVAERLAVIAEDKQVLCVTHAPNIAGRGQTHFNVEKLFLNGKTKIQVSLLDAEERVEEIVRMLGGTSQDQVTWKHAQQILITGRK
ncbi:MAG: DNA repair protein RecN [Syntrophaceticus sp.]|jgi:DNA repair protein RecN (Recombination protein N)|nr:DNA repair protein RecN [Syntrophaceticus sp.]